MTLMKKLNCVGLFVSIIAGCTSAGAEEAVSPDLKAIAKKFPEIGRYRTDAPDPRLLSKLSTWAQPGRSVVVYSRSCQPLSLRRVGRHLQGDTHRPTETSGDSRTRSGRRIGFGEFITAESYVHVDKPPQSSSTFDFDDEWIDDAGTTRLRLSKVTDEAVWYASGTEVALSVQCRDQPFGEASCKRWEIVPEFPHEKPGLRMMRPRLVLPESVAGVQAALQGKRFLADFHEVPYLFRTENGCKTYRKTHAREADQRVNSQ